MYNDMSLFHPILMHSRRIGIRHFKKPRIVRYHSRVVACNTNVISSVNQKLGP